MAKSTNRTFVKFNKKLKQFEFDLTYEEKIYKYFIRSVKVGNIIIIFAVCNNRHNSILLEDIAYAFINNTSFNFEIDIDDYIPLIRFDINDEKTKFKIYFEDELYTPCQYLDVNDMMIKFGILHEWQKFVINYI